MQISFNPLDAHERGKVAALLELWGDDLSGLQGSNGEFNPSVLAAAGIGTDASAENTPSAASVFGGAAPLSGVQLGAGATPLDNAPVAQPASLAPLQPGLPGLAPAGLPAAAPSASVATTNHAGGVELDTQGIPWHHEIHASTKSKTQNGQWVKKRGLNDEAKYNRIVSELKALHAGAAPLPPAGGPAAAPTAAPAAATTPAVGMLQLPATLPPLQPLQPAAPTIPANFDELAPRITAAEAAGILPPNSLMLACQARQLPGVVALISRPDFIPTIWSDLQAQYPGLV